MQCSRKKKDPFQKSKKLHLQYLADARATYTDPFYSTEQVRVQGNAQGVSSE